MCGVFAYCNYGGWGIPVQVILDTLFDGLQRLEYRGYDSAGVCVDAPTDAATKRPLVIKHQGKISDLRCRAAEVFSENAYSGAELYNGHVGIGHTRWATHGPPSAVNSHPHVSGPNGEFVVVHNGIITNYAVLKAFLESQGAVFVSETDTEVVPHLCDHLWRKRRGKITLPQLVMEVAARLEGAFALLIKSARYPNELVACKQGSPLVYGMRVNEGPAAGANGCDIAAKGHGARDQYSNGNGTAAYSNGNGAAAANGNGVAAANGNGVAAANGNGTAAHSNGNGVTAANGNGCHAQRPRVEVWLASDSAALLSHTRDVVMLEDGDLLHIDARGHPHIFNALSMTAGSVARADIKELAVTRVGRKIEAEIESVMKGGYDHYMQKEIHEQPKTVGDTMRGRLIIDSKPLQPITSSAADVIFSGPNAPLLDPPSGSGSDGDLQGAEADSLAAMRLAATEGAFDLPRRVGGRAPPHEKDHSPAGVLFSGAMLGAGRSRALPSPPESDVACGATPAAPVGMGLGALASGYYSDASHEPYVRLGGLEDHIEGILRCRRIVFIACGTSYHACLAARKTLEEFAAMPVVVELAGDFMDREAPVFRDDTCVFVSQSGETADTLRALDYAKAKGALCVGITNTVGSAISNATHCGVHLNCGFEIGVASTKAYTSQIVALTMMALVLGADSRAKAAKRIATTRALADLPFAVRGALALDADMRQLAESLKAAQSLIFFGRGYNYSTALEAALKVKEVALIHSEGINAGEMKHGPLALVDENLPIVVIATMDAMHRKMLSVIEQLLARSAKLIILCNEGDSAMDAFAARGCSLIRVPRTEEALQPIVNIVPLQLLSYHLTTLRGFNVDQPRNLAKSVTVTED